MLPLLNRATHSCVVRRSMSTELEMVFVKWPLAPRTTSTLGLHSHLWPVRPASRLHSVTQEFLHDVELSGRATIEC